LMANSASARTNHTWAASGQKSGSLTTFAMMGCESGGVILAACVSVTTVRKGGS
jgi:hypothetical protein